MIEFLLRRDDRQHAEQLRAQAEELTAIGTCDTDGCPCLKLAVDRSAAPRADSLRGEYVTAASVTPDSSPTVFVHLWCKDGWLDYLEVSWIGETTPSELPMAEDLRILWRGLTGDTTIRRRSRTLPRWESDSLRSQG